MRDLIHERTGIFYDDGKGALLAEKLSPLAIERGFASLLDYYYLLKYDESAGQEWRRVMDALSVQETYFWREMDQVRAFVDVLVPEWVRDNPGVPLRIWSAACASGEEPLTVAMALNEAGWFDRLQIHISASDASEAAIQKAQRGSYRERSMRNLPDELRSKYFTKDDGALWNVDPALKRRIGWSTVNLVNESDVGPLASVPFIFCRNVFIYFSTETIRRTVGVFSKYMHRRGYLFVGSSESLFKLTNEFELREVCGAFIYQVSKQGTVSV